MKSFRFVALAACALIQTSFSLPPQTQEEAQKITQTLNQKALTKGKSVGKAPSPQQPSAPLQFHSKSKTLPNGLQVIVIEDRSMPRVSFGVLYHVGTADDPENLVGISHMTEHLLFVGGSTKYPDAMKAFNSLGCSSNAWTTYDHTCYITDGPCQALEQIMDIEADRMQNYRLRDKAIFKAENGAVFQERLMSRENPPLGLAGEYIQASLSPQHPYGKPVIGYRHHIQSYTIEDVNKHIQTWYKPNNATLIIIGQVKAEQVFALAQRYFGPIAKGTVSPRNRLQNALKTSLLHTIDYTTSEVASPKIQFRYDTPHSSTHDLRKVLAFDLGFDALFGGPVFSFCRYWDQKGVSLIDAANDVNGHDPVYALVEFQLSKGNSTKAFQRNFLKRLRRVLQQGLPKEDFERAKRGTRNSFYKQGDDHRHMRLSLAFQLNHLSIDQIEQIPQIYESITLEETMEVLREFLLKGPFAIVRLLPKEPIKQDKEGS